MSLKKYLTEAELAAVQPITGDEFDINIRELTNIETVVLEHSEGSITIALDETAMKMLEHCGCTFEDEDEEVDYEESISEQEEEHHYDSDEYKESLNDIRRLSGMKIDELSPAAKQAWVDKVTDKGGWFSGPKPGSLAGMKNDMDTVSNYMKKGPEERNYSPRWKKLHKDIQDKYDRRALTVNKVQGQLSRMDESELTERPGDWLPAATGLLKAVAFLIGVPVIAMGQIYKNDLPIIDSPLGKAMYDAAARGDSYAKQELNRLEDLGVKEIPMQYLEKLSNQYLHKGKLGESAEYQILRATLTEAEYQGRKVQLGKPMQGDVKKFKVYVKDPKTGNVKKVNFGDPNMRIKKSNPARRKSFRARHNCDNPGPRTKARYWSCRKW